MCKTTDMTTTTARKCNCCNTRRIATRTVDIDAHNCDLCSRCFTESGLENEHSDYGHDEPVKGCPTCHGVSCMVEAKTIKATTKAASTAEVMGVAQCPTCPKGHPKPLTQFPTRRDAQGVYVRDTRKCRQCKVAR